MHLPASKQQVYKVTLFTAVYLAASTLTTLFERNFEFILYLVTMLVIMALIFFIHRRVGLSNLILWGLSFWGLLHMIGGLVPIPDTWSQNTESGVGGVVYNLWLIPESLKYDQVIHAYGFGITTWLCWQALSSSHATAHNETLHPTLGLLTLCAAAGMGFGALNEIIEFIATLTIPETNVGGYINTGWDLVYNMIGSTFAASMIYLYSRREQAQKKT